MFITEGDPEGICIGGPFSGQTSTLLLETVKYGSASWLACHLIYDQTYFPKYTQLCLWIKYLPLYKSPLNGKWISIFKCFLVQIGCLFCWKMTTKRQSVRQFINSACSLCKLLCRDATAAKYTYMHSLMRSELQLCFSQLHSSPPPWVFTHPFLIALCHLWTMNGLYCRVLCISWCGECNGPFPCRSNRSKHGKPPHFSARLCWEFAVHGWYTDQKWISRCNCGW